MKTGKIEEIRIEEIEEMETDTMSKLEKVFDTPNKKAFIGFLTAGDPDADSTVQFILEMEKAGADLIEIGIPFSDPTAEGVVIQEANIRSLGNGMTTDGVFEIVKRVREQSQIPLAFMTYVNPVFHYGYEKFFTKCEELGISAIIIPDVPYEEKAEVEATAIVESIRAVTDVPCAIGFGISTPEQAKAMASISDGAIVGSAIVKIIAKYGKDAAPYIGEYVKSMKEAVAEA